MTVQTETHLVLLLNQLCSRLMERENAHLLDLFFNGGIEGSESTGMDTTRSLILYFCSWFRTKDTAEPRWLLRLMQCWFLLIQPPKEVVNMFLVFWFVPLSLSYDPKGEGHPFKVKGIIADAKMLFHRKLCLIQIFFLQHGLLQYNISLKMSVAFSHKNLPVWNIHQSNAW